jgi:hypothetical protein
LTRVEESWEYCSSVLGKGAETEASAALTTLVREQSWLAGWQTSHSSTRVRVLPFSPRRCSRQIRLNILDSLQIWSCSHHIGPVGVSQFGPLRICALMPRMNLVPL